MFLRRFISLQVERGVASKGTEVEVLGLGESFKTTLTGIGMFYDGGIQKLRLSFRNRRNVPQGTRPGKSSTGE